MTKLPDPMLSITSLYVFPTGRCLQQDCNSFAQVHRLNQHMEICSSTKQQPGAVESCSSQQMCCQHTRKGYAQITSEVTLSFGFRAFYFTFSNEVGAAREASLCLVNKHRTFRAVSNAGLTNTRCCWSTNAPQLTSSVPHLPSPPGKTSQFH